MTEDPDMDDKIGALLRGAARAPDEAFVSRMQRIVEAERRMEAQRRAAWRRFAAEALASAAIALAFVLVARLDRAVGDKVDLTALSPAMAAALLIGLWLAVGFRPASAEK